MEYDSKDRLDVLKYPKSINWRAKRLAVLWFRTNNFIFGENSHLELSDYYHFIGVPLKIDNKARNYVRKFYGDNN